ncbi:hypothetical protein K438DRAFT_1773392 [Mycena galopus ATCC 62051]|nr:hypothetical protein K438DRAFT_1773392 [Mycena galopus ATCC 62051]
MNYLFRVSNPQQPTKNRGTQHNHRGIGDMKEDSLRWSYSSLEIISGKIHQDLDQLISRKSDHGRHGPGLQWRRRGVGDALVLLVQCLSATFAADANFRPAQPKREGLPKKAQGWMRNLLSEVRLWGAGMQ